MTVGRGIHALAAREKVISSRPVPLWRLLDPLHMLRVLWTSRNLCRQLAVREVKARYRGSYLGFAWSLLTPLVMLSIYTFVFGHLFRARWPSAAGSSTGSIADFALNLFCGLLVFNLVSESMIQAPTLFFRNPNLVNKVVFPLEVMPIAVLGASLVSALMGYVIVAVGATAVGNHPGWTMLLLPLMLLPVAMSTLGVSWFLATLGVFVRDLGNSVAVFTQLLMFATPIFYPGSLVRDKGFGWVLRVNQLSGMVANVREIVLRSQQPNWAEWGMHLAIGAIFMVLGYAAFRKGRRGFADVI